MMSFRCLCPQVRLFALHRIMKAAYDLQEYSVNILSLIMITHCIAPGNQWILKWLWLCWVASFHGYWKLAVIHYTFSLAGWLPEAAPLCRQQTISTCPKSRKHPNQRTNPVLHAFPWKKNKVKYFLNRSHITSMPSGMKSGSVPKLSSDALPMPEMQLSPHSASLKQVCISNLVSPCNF